MTDPSDGAAGIGTNAAGEVIWNEEDHMDLLRTGS